VACLEARVTTCDPTVGGSNTIRALNDLLSLTDGDHHLLLELVEYVLRLGVAGSSKGLRLMLAAANSVYAVNDNGDGLEVLVDPMAKDQVRAVIAEVSSASCSEHLKNAWNKAYGLNPDPVNSYSESIKAVEAAVIPILARDDSKATLGKAINNLKNGKSNFKTVVYSPKVDALDRVGEMLSLLWDGQSGRHGGNAPTRHQTLDECRFAVHLAVTLVQMFSSGAVSRIDRI